MQGCRKERVMILRAGFAEPGVLASKVVDNDEGHKNGNPSGFTKILRFSVVTRKT